MMFKKERQLREKINKLELEVADLQYRNIQLKDKLLDDECILSDFRNEVKYLKAENKNLLNKLTSAKDSEKRLKKIAKYHTSSDVLNALKKNINPEAIALYVSPDFFKLDKSNIPAGFIHYVDTGEQIEFCEDKMLAEFKSVLEYRGLGACHYKVYEGHLALEFLMKEAFIGETGDNYTFEEFLKEKLN